MIWRRQSQPIDICTWSIHPVTLSEFKEGGNVGEGLHPSTKHAEYKSSAKGLSQAAKLGSQGLNRLQSA